MRKLCIATLLMANLCAPAGALRDTAHGTVTKSDDSEIIVAFGEHEGNVTERTVTSGSCKLHWGVLSLGPDGSALLKLEVSSLSASDKWRGQFLLRDKEDNELGNVPSSGTFEVEIKELLPKGVGLVIPMNFEASLFKSISSARMIMEC